MQNNDRSSFPDGAFNKYDCNVVKVDEFASYDNDSYMGRGMSPSEMERASGNKKNRSLGIKRR